MTPKARKSSFSKPLKSFALLNDGLRAELEEIASKMTYMEFSVARSFMAEYM